MDGGGRLDQPLMRSGLRAAEEAGPPVDEPHAPRAENDKRRVRTDRLAWRPAEHRLLGRWSLRIVRLPPPGLGIAGSVLLLAATLGYGSIARGHVAAVVGWLKDARDGAANAIGFRIAAISLAGQKEVSREEIL